jgi:hypothetical protein
MRNTIVKLSAVKNYKNHHEHTQTLLQSVEEKWQAVKQLKPDIFLKKPAQKNSDETSDKPLPSTSSEGSQKPSA